MTNVVSVTASGTINTKGAWAELVAATSLESFGFWLSYSDVFITATNTSMLVDIGIGAAGSEVVIVPDINCAGAERGLGKQTFWPLFVPAGVHIAARTQAVIASDTVNVRIFLLQSPQTFDPYIFNTCTAYGVDATNSRGTSYTPHATAFTKGSWAQVSASSSRDHRAWQVIVDPLGSTALTGAALYVDIGAGAAASEQVVSPDSYFVSSVQEIVDGPVVPVPAYCPVASGTRIAVRGSASGASMSALGAIVYAFD